MRTRTRVALAIGTGVVATALLASPVLAADQGGGPKQQNTQQAVTCDRTGAGMGTPGSQNGQGATMGQGAGMGRGAGIGAGVNADLTNVASGTLTDSQKSAVTALAEEETSAHDLYVAFASEYSTPVFTRIANAETQHLTELRILLDRYAVTDPTAGHVVGKFANAAAQKRYDEPLAQGSAGLTDAYAAARTVESADVADLTAAKAEVTAPDALQVYTNLITAPPGGRQPLIRERPARLSQGDGVPSTGPEGPARRRWQQGPRNRTSPSAPRR
jgi:hypothetical protein